MVAVFVSITIFGKQARLIGYVSYRLGHPERSERISRLVLTTQATV